MNVFIAEDEPPARDRLIATLARMAPNVTVMGHSDTVHGTLAWLAAHPPPDLLLLDIQLADGLSLELFRDRQLALPTIFTTAYDQFALQAFQALAVDYLLKPVSDAALSQALAKAAQWRQHFDEQEEARWISQLGGLLQRLSPAQPTPFRQRLVGRKGAQFHALDVASAAYFVSLDKLTFAFDRSGERFLIDETLGDLQACLDPQQFFRANRQVLIAVSAVHRFSPAGKGRLKLELTPSLHGELLISQERAGDFKTWLEH